MKEIAKENKMGVMPIPKLLMTMSLPMVISMLVQALYNVVDSMFVAQLNENALTAVSLAFPIQNLMISILTGTGVGINALLSRSLGEKKFDKANQVAMHGLLLAGCSYLIFLILGIFGSHAFFAVQTQDAQILGYGTDYMRIICICGFGISFQVILERLLQSTGRTMYSMVTQSVGALTNIVLDPIMIFGLFGFPRLEVAGAALATVTGQTVAAILALTFNIKRNHELRFSFRDFSVSGRIIREIYSVGIPSIIMASIGSVMTFGMNKILIAFTSTATAVFGVYFKIQSFVFMPVFGLNNGMVPIIAYNYGARKNKRIMETIRDSVFVAAAIMLAGLAVFQLMPDKLLGIFNASEEMMSIGEPALRIISVSFLLAGFNIVSSSIFQALGHGVLSLIVSVVRQLFVLLPVAFLFSRTAGLQAIWWSFPIAELVAFALCAAFLRKIKRTKIDPLGQNH